MTTATKPDPAAPAPPLESHYSVDSVTQTPSPFADDTRDWYSYVIGQGNNRIVGQRPGSAETVRRAAEDLVMRLNERRNFRAGRKQLVIGPAKNAKPRTAGETA
ncbi:MAG TPA: hypothetical protein VEZ88_08790 [Steroidobacteraceae bacterium]|nr:hypothetical protein [Steroidobacteraceae bacterium]